MTSSEQGADAKRQRTPNDIRSLLDAWGRIYLIWPTYSMHRSRPHRIPVLPWSVSLVVREVKINVSSTGALRAMYMCAK